MTGLTYLCIYLGVAVFLAGCVRRILQYGRAPMHLRWELYPVPHEHPARVAHGGSYYEESEWWTKPRRRHLRGELSFMLPEMLLLKGLWEFNRPLWFRSFPFHAGLYLLIASAAGTLLLDIAARFGFAAAWLHIAVRCTVWIGLFSTIIGGTLLLLRRVTDRKLRDYSSPLDYVNVALFSLACVLVLVGKASSSAPATSQLAAGLLSFDTSLVLPPALSAGLMLGSLIVAYVPYSHMGHFIAKYFTYHTVRWDDEPNLKNSRIASTMAEYLSYSPTWSASHIAADGRKTWAEIATSNPAGVAKGGDK